MKSIRVTFQTLTPLWTGDAWGNGNELKLTGIFGSLRWWFEALVRGMGYNVCDSTSENKCKVEVKNEKDVLKIHEKICPVCFLFGATGWKSRVSVKIIDEPNIELIEPIEIRTRTDKHKVRGSNSYLSRYCKGLFGEFSLEFSFDPYLSDGYITLFVKLLQFLSEWGMIGANISQGNGVCEISFKDDVKKYVEKKFSDITLTKNNEQKKCNYCVNFQKLRLLKVKFSFNQKIENNEILSCIWRKDSRDGKALRNIIGNIDNTWHNFLFLPIGFHIRDLLRGIWHSNNKLRHNLMGEMGKASNIFVSHGYKISDSEIEFRIIGINIDDTEWKKFKSNLTVDKVNRIMFFKRKSYINKVNFVKEITGETILNGGISS